MITSDKDELEELKLIETIAMEAQGRCHSCIHSLAFDLPTGTKYWCRVLDYEMDSKQRSKIRNCPHWEVFAIGPDSPKLNSKIDPLIREIIDAEDKIFWKVDQHLRSYNLDLKTTLAIAHPGANTLNGDLDWLDSLHVRFSGEEMGNLTETLEELRALSYFSLVAIIERMIHKNT